MPTAEGTMKNLVLNSHLCKLDDTIEEYEARLIKPDNVVKDNNREAKESIQDRYHAYEKLERFDRALYFMVIESIVSPYFCEFIKTHFSHYN